MSDTIILLIFLIFYSIIGAIVTIIIEFLNGEGLSFHHFWFTNTLMFLAEILALLLYYITTHIRKRNQKLEFEENQEKSKELEEIEINPQNKKVLLFFIPSTFGTIATFISDIGVSLLPGSLYIMLKGLTIILVTCFISKRFLKDNYTCDHWISIIFAFIGFIILGFSGFFFQSNDEKDKKKSGDIAIGIGATFVAMVFQSMQFCFEEFYIRKYSLQPFLCIGFEGVFGFIFNSILCIIFYFIKCGKDPGKFIKDLCTQDEHNWRMENVIFAFQQISENKTILILIIFLFICLFPYNVCGISINKYGGALTRSLIENFKYFLVWLFFLIPFKGNLHEDFNWLRLLGLLGKKLFYPKKNLLPS